MTQTTGWRGQQTSTQTQTVSYPNIQITHIPGAFNPRPATGMFYQRAASAEALGASIGVACTYYPEGKPSEQGAYAPTLEIAVLRTRDRLIKGRKENARVVDKWEEGVHQHVQIACLVRLAGGTVVGPVTLSIKSSVAKSFWAALKAHRAAVAEKTDDPDCGYFFTFAATRLASTLGGATVTIYERVDDFDPARDFVGDATMDVQDWKALDTWAAGWGDDNGNGNGVAANAAPTPIPPSAPAPTPTPAPVPPTPPAAQTEAAPGSKQYTPQQIAAIRFLLKTKKGCADQAAQDAALAAMNLSWATLTFESAGRVIDQLQSK
jgi:hypothetical protein